VSIGDLSDRRAFGICDWKRHEITVDIAAHASDAAVRTTLLHEMAHAAETATSQYTHGDGFFQQIEYLLRRHAPISLEMSEMPGHRLPLAAVPKKFPLCRKAAAKLSAAKRRAPHHAGVIPAMPFVVCNPSHHGSLRSKGRSGPTTALYGRQ